MKKRIIIFISILTIAVWSVNAQAVDSIELKVQHAISLLQGATGRIDAVTSFQQLTELSGRGSARAMNALGLYYLEGKGGVVDTLAGIGWLKFAGDAGYAQAWHNLGLVYKYGRSGVKQDLAQAYLYMNKAAVAGYPVGMYDAGYMLYKGLGCKQDYEKAVVWFRQGAMLESVPCMYMLGLCYRNGYGVDKDSGNAQYWLSLSARRGHSPSASELAADTPENSLSRVMLRSASTIAAPDTYPRIPHLRSLQQNNLDGNYEGVLVTYDWSGKVVLKESPISLTLKSNAETVEAEWREQGADTIQVMGVWQDTCLQFTRATQMRSDHYTGVDKVIWNFTDARLQVLNDQTSSFLVGNVQMYSPETMEPSRPVYLNLKKTSGEQLVAPKEAIKDDFVVYPNPFSDGLNISFYQQKTSDVSVAVYNTTGGCVYRTALGRYESGRQNLTLLLSIPAGVYVLKLYVAGKEYQSVVIRK